MKNSLKKLRGLALHHRHGDHHKEHMDLRPLRQSDEISRASQDMEDMRDCYDSLLSAAAATANSAYEFSESLREMGACLLEKTALNDDEESGKVLLMLGKLQFELQKLVDSYRSHIFQTITIPSESLLNELRTVEEMKHQCDEKREIYEFIRTRLRDKGRGRSGKGESVSVEHLQAAHDEYDDEAALFVFRLKSLKQGQSRSLLTQAARHHAAQLCFFKKALKSLEAVEPHVKSVTEQQHIDYNFTGIEDYDGDNAADDNDDDDNDDDDDDTHDDGELSFDYRQNDQENIVTTSGNSMDVDMTDITFPSIAPVETSKENIEGSYRKSFSYRVEIRPGSQSAPLFADNKPTPADKLKQMRPSSTRKFNSYVLPTPRDAQNPNFTASGSLVPRTLKTSLSGRPHNLWHSSPLDPKKYNKFVDDKLSGPTVINVHSVLRESNNNVTSTQLPRPLVDRLFASRPDPLGASDYKKIKRYAFSGPIGGKPWPAKQISVEQPQLFSGPLLQNSRGLSSSPPQVSPKLSPKASPSASPKFMSSPKISELHELPRPPANSTSKSSKPVSLVGHSAPLMPKANVLPNTGKSLVPKAASPLPTPSQVVTRCFSIPSSGLRAMALNVSKPQEAVRNAEITESDASPPLTPIDLSDTQKLQSGPETVNQTVQIRDID